MGGCRFRQFDDQHWYVDCWGYFKYFIQPVWCISQGQSQPPSDTSLSGSMDLKNANLNYANGVYTVTFERLLKTNDPFDYEIIYVCFI